MAVVVVGGWSGLLEMGTGAVVGRLAVGQVVAHLEPLDPGTRQNEYPEGKQAEKPQAKPSFPTKTHLGKLLTWAPAIQHEAAGGGGGKSPPGKLADFQTPGVH